MNQSIQSKADSVSVYKIGSNQSGKEVLHNINEHQEDSLGSAGIPIAPERAIKRHQEKSPQFKNESQLSSLSGNTD